jgi:N,N-dimethylformamidase beta subunit-like, C-terminal
VSWTGTWRDTRWVDRDPENNLLAMTFRMNGVIWLDPVVPSLDYGANPFWRGTSLESADLTLTDCVGFEGDEIDVPADDRGWVVLANDILNIDGRRADDNGQIYDGDGNMNWGIIMHQRRSDHGVVVSFGSNSWAWMLSDFHRGQTAVKQTPCQQAMVNLLKDLGVSAASLNTGDLTDPTAVAISEYGMTVPQAPGEERLWDSEGNAYVPYLKTEDNLLPIYLP